MPPLRRTRKTHNRGNFTHEPIRVRDDLADRQSAAFTCPKGHEFRSTFAASAVPPKTWECRHHSIQAEYKDTPPQEQQPARTHNHWDMIRQRRSESELAQLLTSQLQALRAGQLVTVEQWLAKRK